MENKVLIDTYRNKLTNLHGLTVSVVSLLEIIGYIIFVRIGVQSLSFTNEYLWLAVIMPIFINGIVHLAARIIGTNPNIADDIKNATIVYAAMLTAVIISIVHREFLVTACAFVFPMILCTLFNDRKLLSRCLVITIAEIIAIAALIAKDGGIDLTILINYIVLCGFAAISYLSACVAIDNSELNHFVIMNQQKTNNRLRNRINKDQMTNLYNHKMFHEELAAAIELSKQTGKEFCLAMLDIDDFKRINDTYGHNCGDTVLTTLAAIIKKHCSHQEMAFRYGGEEFAIILRQKTLAESGHLTEKILADFRNTKFKFTDESISFSGGVAQYCTGMTKEEIFELADDSMYFAKNNGKNQIHCVVENHKKQEVTS